MNAIPDNLKAKCKAKQYSDQMYCEDCGITWDMNDLYPPKCGRRAGKGSGIIRVKQSRMESILETVANTASGFILSWAIYQWCVVPYHSFYAKYGEAFWVTVLFTFVSVARSYVWRRFFNAELHKAISKLFRKAC